MPRDCRDAKTCCQDLIKTVTANWQGLPILAPERRVAPILVKARVSYEGRRSYPEQPLFPSATEAIRSGLAKMERPMAILLGDAGLGKSVALKWAAREYAEAFLSGSLSEAPLIPFYVDLGKWNTLYADCDSLDSLLQRCLLPNMDDGVRRIWFMDGLDLLPTTGRLEAISVLETAYERAHAGERFVFSSRHTTTLNHEIERRHRYCVISLEHLDDAIRNAWVEKYYPEVLPELPAFLKEHPELACLQDTPMQFTMIVCACLDKMSSRWTRYPGLAGLLDGFISLICTRAVVERRISEEDLRNFDQQQTFVVNAAFWAAAISGASDRIRWDQIEDHLATAYPSGHTASVSNAWAAATATLRRVGLLIEAPDEKSWIARHQLFAEHWAARHLSKRLQSAHKLGWLDVELWDHFQNDKLDLIVFQALGMLCAESCGQDILREAFRNLRGLNSKLLPSNYASQVLDSIGKQHKEHAIAAMISSPHASDRAMGAKVLWRCVYHSKMPRDSQQEIFAEYLPRLLTDEDARVADEAHFLCSSCSKKYGQEFTQRLVNSLIELTNDPRDHVRVESASALLELDICDWRTIHSALSAAQRTGPERAIRLLPLLGPTKDDAAFRFLVSLLADKSPNVRHAAALGLHHSSHRHLVAALVAALGTRDIYLRMRVADILGARQDKRLLTTIIRLIKRPDWRLQWGAVNVLAHMKAPWNLSPLRELVHDRRHLVRCAAVLALGNLRARQEVEFLIGLLSDRSSCVQHAAAIALGMMGDDRAVQPLFALMKGRNGRLRRAAAKALLYLDCGTILEELTAIIRGPDIELRSMAQTLLAASNKWYVRHRDRHCCFEDERRSLPDHSALVADHVNALLHNGEPDVRRRALRIRPEKGVDANVVLELTKDPVASVRYEALSWLRQEHKHAPLGLLLPLLNDSDKHVRIEAILLSGRCGENAVEHLAAFLRDADSDIRKATVKALEDTGSKKAARYVLASVGNRAANGGDLSCVDAVGALLLNYLSMVKVGGDMESYFWGEVALRLQFNVEAMSCLAQMRHLPDGGLAELALRFMPGEEGVRIVTRVAAQANLRRQVATRMSLDRREATAEKNTESQQETAFPNAPPSGLGAQSNVKKSGGREDRDPSCPVRIGESYHALLWETAKKVETGKWFTNGTLVRQLRCRESEKPDRSTVYRWLKAMVSAGHLVSNAKSGKARAYKLPE